MTALARALGALALAAGVLATGGSASAHCTTGVPDAVCAQLPVHTPRCWVDTYRWIVTCEHLIQDPR